jgi:spermidine synthase
MAQHATAYDDIAPVTIDRREGPYGELALRRHGEHFEIIANGCFLMDTSDGRSERLLVRAARDTLPGRTGMSVLIGGLGVGFSLAEAAAGTAWERIVVVERESAVVDWHRHGPLAPFSEYALDDSRVEVIETDLVSYVQAAARPSTRDAAARTYDALCLDIDNGPDWTVTDGNIGLYGPEGLAACQGRLAPGGVLAVWSAQPSAAFEEALEAAGFSQVRTIEIPVIRGVPDVVHLAHKPA